jgi:hypothetical protein
MDLLEQQIMARHSAYVYCSSSPEVLTAHWGLFQCMHVCAACLSAGLDLLAGTRLKIDILVVMFIYRDPFIFDCHLAYSCLYVFVFVGDQERRKRRRKERSFLNQLV